MEVRKATETDLQQKSVLMPIEDAKRLFNDGLNAQLVLTAIFAMYTALNLASGGVGLLVGLLSAYLSYSHLTKFLEMRRIMKQTERFLNGSSEQGN